MTILEFILFCIGIFTVLAIVGALAAALGSKFGKYLAERRDLI